MPASLSSQSIDFDALFEPEVAGNGVAAPGLSSGGAPLRYAARALGSKRANVGVSHGGSDVSNLWAARGSVVYVSDGGLPGALANYLQGPPGGPSLTASVSFEYRSDGMVTWGSVESGMNVGQWLGGGFATGDYEIKFDVVSGAGFSGTTGQWLRLNANRGGSLSVTSSGSQTVSRSTTLNVTMRKRSDQSIVFAREITMSAGVDRDS